MKKIALLATFLLAPLTTHAQLAGLVPPKMQKTVLNYSGTLHDSADFPPDSANTSFQSLDISVPVYKTDDESYSVSLNGNQLSVRPVQGEFSEFYDLKLGLSYTKALDEQRMWSASIRYGSASDKPFSGADVSTIGATWIYTYPSDETSRWLLLVDYSNNRPILNNIPLPGFAYFYYPNKDFKATFGVPFASFTWGFADKWALDFFTLVPWIYKISTSYKISEYGRIYAGLDFSQVTYYLADRQNKNDRLFFDEKKVFVGIKSPLSKEVSAEFEVGHAFDRAFFVAEEYEIDPENPLTIGNAYYAKMTLRMMF